MTKYFIIASLLVTFAACGVKNDKLVGNIYLHEEGPAKQYIGFYQDSLIFKWKDELGTEYFTTPYKMKQLNDSTINIEVMNKHKWMDSSSWDIILDKDGGFHSASSKKKYVINTESIK